MPERLTKLAWALLLATAATGGIAWVMGFYGPGYFTLLEGHWWIAWAAMLAGPLALAAHLRSTRSGAWAPAVALAVGGVLAIPIPYALDMPEEEHDSGPLLYLVHSAQDLLGGDTSVVWPVLAGTALVGMLGAAVLLTLIGVVSRTQERDASRRTGLALTMVVGWAFVGGALLDYEPLATRVPAQNFHSVAGTFAIGLVVLHLLAQRAARMRIPRPVVVLVGLVLVVVYAGVMGARSRAAKLTTNQLFVEIPRTAAERNRSLAGDGGWTHVDASELVGFEDCATAGCHPDVTDQWAGSAHRFSASNAFYRAVTDELIADGRWTDVVFCAGCHDPTRVLAGTVKQAYASGVPESGSDGVSCVVCHSITEVAGSYGETGFEAAGNGEFAIAVEPPYPGAPGPERVRNLKLDTRHHRDVFVFNELIYRNEPCRACHRIDLGRLHDEAQGIVVQHADMPDRPGGAFEAYCRECHLPPDSELQIDYTHRMSGINADLGLYATGLTAEDRDLLQDAREETIFFAGLTPHGPIDAPSWGTSRLRPGIDRGITLTMRLRPRIEGEELVLGVTTSNLGVGHSFPGGPFDLQEVWMELLITDAGGDTVVHRGRLGEDGEVDDPPLRLGARELDAQGRPILRHRILDARAVADKRVIPREGKLDDEIRISLPEDVRYPLEARARWLFRRARPEFSRWALGREDGVMPTWELAITRRTIDGP